MTPLLVRERDAGGLMCGRVVDHSWRCWSVGGAGGRYHSARLSRANAVPLAAIVNLRAETLGSLSVRVDNRNPEGTCGLSDAQHRQSAHLVSTVARRDEVEGAGVGTRVVRVEGVGELQHVVVVERRPSVTKSPLTPRLVRRGAARAEGDRGSGGFKLWNGSGFRGGANAAGVERDQCGRAC